jgi:hypothetical protein
MRESGPSSVGDPATIGLATAPSSNRSLNDVQLDHDQPSRHRRAVPGNQPLRRQLCPEYFPTIRPRWRATTIPGRKSRDRQEGRGLVRNQRRSSAVGVRRPMDHVQRRSRSRVETGARFALGLGTPDNSAKPDCQTGPSQSQPAILTTPEERCVDARTLRRSKSASTVIAG